MLKYYFLFADSVYWHYQIVNNYKYYNTTMLIYIIMGKWWTGLEHIWILYSLDFRESILQINYRVFMYVVTNLRIIIVTVGHYKKDIHFPKLEVNVS